VAGRGARSKLILSKRRSPNTDHPVFAKYRKMLSGLEALEKKGEEVRRKAQARRRQTLG
jgi:hypothetical protein